VPNPVSIQRNDILGAVLCGGKSTRFGSPKAFYEFEGRTLVERALRVLGSLVSDVALAIGDSDSKAWPDVSLVRDRIAAIGPMGGIHALLHEMGHEWLLVLPVDVPFMTTDALSSLSDEAHEGDEAVIAIDSAERLHPLCGLYHRSMLPACEGAISRKEYGLTRLLTGMNNVRYVTLPDECLRNVNRPEDLP